MKILHFALEDYSRIPGLLVREERKAGHQSYLAVLTDTFKAYGQHDYHLKLPAVGSPAIVRLREGLYRPSRKIDNRRRSGPARRWHPRSPAEKMFFSARDALWRPRVRRFLEEIDWRGFDLLVLDGGSGFLRDASFVRAFKEAGKKIICIYYGSDLRTRGIIPAADELADARFTFEFDHTLLDPGLTFLYYPYDPPKNIHPPRRAAGPIPRVGHAPTNRAAKGSERILEALYAVDQRTPLEIVLIENKPFREAMALKASCDIFIDQIGELGYGVNSLEALAMGIPAAVELMDDFDAFLQPHPFLRLRENSLENDLERIITDPEARETASREGPAWVARRHDPATVSAKILAGVTG